MSGRAIAPLPPSALRISRCSHDRWGRTRLAGAFSGTRGTSPILRRPVSAWNGQSVPSPPHGAYRPMTGGFPWSGSRRVRRRAEYAHLNHGRNTASIDDRPRDRPTDTGPCASRITALALRRSSRHTPLTRRQPKADIEATRSADCMARDPWRSRGHDGRSQEGPHRGKGHRPDALTPRDRGSTRRSAPRFRNDPGTGLITRTRLVVPGVMTPPPPCVRHVERRTLRQAVGPFAFACPLRSVACVRSSVVAGMMPIRPL